MAAKALSDVAALRAFILNHGKQQVEVDWVAIWPALDAIMADQAQLKTALETIDAMTGPDDLADAQVVSTAAIAASEALIV